MGDIEQQFLSVYENFSRGLFRMVFMKIGDRERAKDIVQDVFTRTWEKLSRGQNIENLKGFIWRSASNAVIDEYRRKKPESLDTLLEQAPERAHLVADEETLKQAELSVVLDALERLSEQHRSVLEMRFLAGLAVPEISALLSERENTVSVRINRALLKLRDELGINHES